MALCFALSAFALPATARAEDAPPPDPVDADDLLARAFSNLYADDYIQTLELANSSRSGRELSRTLQIIRKQSERPGKALVRFIEPAAVRKTSILILENDEASDDLYIYLPAIERTKHLSSSQRADAFFGTDLCYEDIEPKHARDYEARWVGSDSHQGIACERIELRPRPHYESTYEHMHSCIEAERGVILWTEFYRHGQVVKILTIDPESIRELGTRHIPFLMRMRKLRSGTETRLVTEDYELRPEIDSKIFTTVNLEIGSARRDRSRAGDAPRDTR